MEEMGVYEIWPSATGIADLPSDWERLCVPAIADIIPIWSDEQNRLRDTDQLRIFNEQLAREWAIKTGVIEDVFHIDRGTTVTLIEQGLSAALIEHDKTDKAPEYVINILRDHVEALDWIKHCFVIAKQPMTAARIKELHALMTAHQTLVDAYIIDPRTEMPVPTKVPLLRGAWKIQPNNVERHGQQFRYCDPLHTDEEMVKLVGWHKKHEEKNVMPEVEAAWLHHRFTQIHPFHDGNGRVARALASLVFIKAGLFPLIIEPGAMRDRYIAGLEAADKGDLQPLVKLFAEAQQIRFEGALKVSDKLTVKPLGFAIEALKNRLSSRADEVAVKQKGVFALSRKLEAAAKARLETLCQELAPIEAHVTVSSPETEHYYRGQVIDAARVFGYFANTTPYRSWVKLVIPASLGGQDDPVAQLLLSFHGRGTEFVGVMVCAPVFELTFPAGNDGVLTSRTQIPVTDRPFEFYYTEKLNEVEPRFLTWLEETVALALSQLQRNL